MVDGGGDVWEDQPEEAIEDAEVQAELDPADDRFYVGSDGGYSDVDFLDVPPEDPPYGLGVMRALICPSWRTLR